MRTGAGSHRPPFQAKREGTARLFGGGRQRLNRDMDAVARLAGERHLAVDQREDRVVAPQADILPRVPLGAALADQDVAGGHRLAAELLDAEAPPFGVAAVAR